MEAAVSELWETIGVITLWFSASAERDERATLPSLAGSASTSARA
jgi:hypothetical protein